MATLGDFVVGLERGVRFGLPIAQRGRALAQQQRALEMREQQAGQAAFAQGLQVLSRIHQIPKPFRPRVLQEVNQRSFGNAFDEDTLKQFAQLNEADSQMMAELMAKGLPGVTPDQFRAMTRQMGGMTEAFTFLASVAEREQALAARQQQRDDMAALGRVGQRGVLAAREPAGSTPPPQAPPGAPPSRPQQDFGQRLDALQRQLDFFQNTAEGQRLVQTPQGQARFQQIRGQVATTLQLQREARQSQRDQQDRQLAQVNLQRARIELAESRRSAQGAFNAKDRQEFALKLRSNIRQEPQFKKFVEAQGGWNSVQEGAKRRDAFGDLAIVNGIVRLLDPGSVNRPSEVQTAEQAQGVLARWFLTPERFFRGDRLTDWARQSFHQLGAGLFNRWRDDVVTVGNQVYKPAAEDAGIDFARVFVTPKQVVMPKITATAPTARGVSDFLRRPLEKMRAQTGRDQPASTQPKPLEEMSDQEVMDEINQRLKR